MPKFKVIVTMRGTKPTAYPVEAKTAQEAIDIVEERINLERLIKNIPATIVNYHITKETI